MRYWLSTAVLVLLSTSIAVPCHADNIRLTNNAGASQRPAVFIDAAGDAAVVWQDDRDGNFEIYWRRFNRFGLPVTNEMRVTNTAAQSYWPDISCDASGASYVVWQEGLNVNGVGDVQFAAIDADGDITAGPTSMKSFSGGARISTRGDGTSDIVFHRFSVADQDVYFQRRNGEGTLLCEQRFNAGTIPALDKTPTVAALSSTAALYWRDMNQVWMDGLWNGGVNFSCEKGGGQIISSYSAINPDADGDPATDVVWMLFEQSGSIRNYRGSGSSCVIAGTGGASRPRVATDGAKGFVTWRDTRDGNSEIYMCRFYGCDNETGDVRITNDPSGSQNPDIAAPRDGSSEWVIVWQDDRDGNWEIYLESNVEPATVRVTAAVRPEYRDESFLPDAQPLEGVSVTLPIEGADVERFTNADGVAEFPTRPMDGAYYTLKLSGPAYHIEVYDPTPVVPSLTVPMDAALSRTNVQWTRNDEDDLSQGAAIQAAYFVKKFRFDFWRNRLGYEWTWPTTLDPALYGNDAVRVEIYRNNVELGDAGGAATCCQLTTMQFLRHQSEEADNLYHEYGHLVVVDRFATLKRTARLFATRTNPEGESAAMDEAIPDYFAATATNDPKIYDCKSDYHLFCIPLRDISKRRMYPTCEYRYDKYDGSLILSSALWELRNLIDGEGVEEAIHTDSLVIAAIDTMIASHPRDHVFEFSDLYDALVEVDTDRGGVYQAQIEEAFARSNLGPGQGPHCPISWSASNAFETVRGFIDRVELSWESLSGAMSYELLVSEVDYKPDRVGIGNRVPLATGLLDTMYVFRERNRQSEYLFWVAAVDSSGEPGYLSGPVFVPRVLPRTDKRFKEEPTGSAESGAESHADAEWLYNSPNPFNPSTRIAFRTPRDATVRISIFDVAGRRVRVERGLSFGSGFHVWFWDGTDDHGAQAASGPYWVVIESSDWKISGKVLLLK